MKKQCDADPATFMAGGGISMKEKFNLLVSAAPDSQYRTTYFHTPRETFVDDLMNRLFGQVN